MEPGALLESIAEAALLARVAKQDADALAEFYDRSAPVLYSVAHSILADPALAEDVLQEVYLQIWNKAALFNPQVGKPIAWAIALTRHKALDRLRSAKRRDSALQAFGDQQSARQAASDAGLSTVERRDAVDLARQAMRNLPGKQRQAIELALIEGLPHSEVAEVLEEPLGTVKAWIRRGIIAIREQLKDHV